MAYQTKFTFIGEVVIPKKESLTPLLKKWKGGADEDIPMASLNFGVKAKGSVGYVELFGMKTSKIYTMNNNNEKIEVAWADRNDDSIVENVADFKKHVVSAFKDTTEDEDVIVRKEFISSYDAALYLGENLNNGMEVKVKGTVEKEPYVTKSGEKKFKDKYIIQDVFLPNEKDIPGLRINMDFYYTKDSVDKSDFKAEQIITVDGYVRQYLRNNKAVNAAIGDANKEVFMPQKAILNASKLNLKDEEHKMLLASRVDELECDSSKKLYHCTWECALISGSEEVEFTEEQLTPKQKRQVELGIRKLEDFRPSGNIYGPKLKELRLVIPILRGEFEDGVVEADFTLRELEDELVKFVERESLDEVVEKAKKKNDDIPFDTDDEDDNNSELVDDLFS